MSRLIVIKKKNIYILFYYIYTVPVTGVKSKQTTEKANKLQKKAIPFWKDQYTNIISAAILHVHRV